MPAWLYPSAPGRWWLTTGTTSNLVNIPTYVTMTVATDATVTQYYHPWASALWDQQAVQQQTMQQQAAQTMQAYVAMQQQQNTMNHDHFAAMARAQARAVRRREQELSNHTADAQQRARDLLLRHLNEEQRESFLTVKSFVVEGPSKTRYRIVDQGHMVGNIVVLDRENRASHRLCGHCAERAIPLGDHLLAQKLMLEADEEAFLKLANRHAA